MPRCVLLLCLLSLLDAHGLNLEAYPNIRLKQDDKGLVWVKQGSRSANADGSFKRPFAAINAAANAVRSGQYIVVREGVYRERITLYYKNVQRAEGIIGYPGETVVMSGNKILTGWTKWKNGIYRTSLSFRPERLTICGVQQRIARYPESGWVGASSNGKDFFVSPKLARQSFGVDATIAYVWTQHGNQFHEIPLNAYDSSTGKVNLKITNKWQKLSTHDKLFLQNNRAFIRKPGSWAYVKNGDAYDIYFRPSSVSDLKKVEVPSPEKHALLQGVYLDGFTIAGMDFAGSGKDGISIGTGSRNVNVRYCRTYDNARYGINLRGVTDSTVANNISILNVNSGVVLHTCKNIVVEKNEIGLNFVDGLCVTWNTSAVQVRNNYIHRHLFWGHPDNAQMYFGVRDIHYVGNFLFASGQALMCADSKDSSLNGNLIVGTVSNTLVLGMKSTGWTMENNTLAFAGYSVAALSKRDYKVCNNIMSLGHVGIFANVQGVSGYEGRENLYFHHKGYSGRKTPVAADTNSIYADPMFKNVPDYYTVIDGKGIPKCTRAKLYLRFGTQRMKKGDFVEINFDGIKRTVTDVGSESITISPALKDRPLKDWLVANWGKNDNFALDFGLKGDSPAIKDGIQTKGSKVDAQAYMKGDFDSDGKRDLPKALPQLQKTIDFFK